MHKCQHPGCDFKHDVQAGLNGHKLTHRTPEEKEAIQVKRRASMARNKKPEIPVDEIFNRVEKATKILFPDPAVFYERFEEIAELRNQMLQVLKR